MTTRAQLEQILIDEAVAHKFKPDSARFKKYVYGTLNRVFPPTRRRTRRTIRPKTPAVTRRKNPVTPRTSRRQMNVIKAIQLFQKFRLEDPRFVDEKTVTFHREMAVIGVCDGLLYTTRRRGKTEKYRHLFTRDSKPLLCASFDGTQLYLIGGRYNFTERGIVDA